MRDKLLEAFPFDTPREGQLEMAEEIIKQFESGKKFVVLNASTGTGKSAIAMTVLRYFKYIYGSSSYLMCSEKILQKQYKEDFDNLSDIKLLMGKNNYICLNNEEDSVDSAICQNLKNAADKLDCWEKCPYRQARRQAGTASGVVSNYSYMLLEFDFIPSYASLGKRELVILDEFHNLENILLNYCSVVLSDKFIKNLINSLTRIDKELKVPGTLSSYFLLDIYNEMKNVPPEDSAVYIYNFKRIGDYYDRLINHIGTYLNREFDLLEDKLIDISLLTEEELKHYKSLKYASNFVSRIKKMRCKLSNMFKAPSPEERWIVNKEIEKGYIEMKPIYVNFLFDSTVGVMADKFLMMSATPINKGLLSRIFDLDKDDIVEIVAPNKFPIENRLVINSGILNMSYKNLNTELPFVVEEVDFIIKNNPDKNIMIHSGNYVIAEYIEKYSKFKDRIILPRVDTRDVCIANFKNSKDAIMISPSLMEGLDLAQDYCRLQLILKIPYASLADKRTKIRAGLDDEWYKSGAINKLVQACGRGVRSKEDYCETIVLDSQFNWLMQKHGHLFPGWFLESVQSVGGG